MSRLRRVRQTPSTNLKSDDHYLHPHLLLDGCHDNTRTVSVINDVLFTNVQRNSYQRSTEYPDVVKYMVN